MRKYVSFLEMATNGNTGWFCDCNKWNCLFEIDLTSGDIHLLSKFPDSDAGNSVLYTPIGFYDNKLLIAPREGNGALIYDLNNNSFKEIKLNKEELADCGGSFFSIEIIGDNAFVFPYFANCILKVDLKSEKVEYLHEWADEYLKLSNDKYERGFPWFTVLHREENKCILPIWGGNYVMIFDLETAGWEFKHFDHKVADVIMTNNNYYSLFDNNSIQTNDELIDLKEYAGIENFYWLYDYENKVCVIPRNGKKIVFLSKQDYSISELIDLSVEPYKKGLLRARWRSNILGKKIINKQEIIICLVLEGLFLIINFENNTIRKIEAKLNSDDDKFINELLWSEIEKEGEKLYIEDLLDTLID